MKVLPQELGALIATMAIEDREVAYWNLFIYPQILYNLIRVFHSIPLPYITHYASVKSLHLELQ